MLDNPQEYLVAISTLMFAEPSLTPGDIRTLVHLDIQQPNSGLPDLRNTVRKVMDSHLSHQDLAIKSFTEVIWGGTLFATYGATIIRDTVNHWNDDPLQKKLWLDLDPAAQDKTRITDQPTLEMLVHARQHPEEYVTCILTLGQADGDTKPDMKDLWVRLGATFQLSDDEVEAIFKQGDLRAVLTKALAEGRYKLDGESYVPPQSVQEVNSRYHTAYKVDAYQCDL